MMPALRIPIVGSYTNRGFTPLAASLTVDQIFENGYPQVVTNPITGHKTVYLLKRIGSTKGGAIASSSCQLGALLSWNAHSAALPPIVGGFFDATATSTSVFNINSGAQFGSDIPNTQTITALTETTLNGTAQLVGNFVDSATGALEQWYFPEGGAWTQVTSATVSSIVGFPAHLDGYVFNMTSDGKILNTDLNTVSTQTATNFISANQSPDKGITVARLGPHIVAFGEKSIERFYNAGNAVGSPLSRVQDGGISMGAARRSVNSPQTVFPAYGTIYWIGTGQDGGVTGIYRFKGDSSPEKISSAAIDNFLVSGAITGFVGSAVLHGMRHVIVRGTNSAGSTIGAYAYCIDTNYWWRLTLATGIITASLAADTSAVPGALTYFLTTGNARGNTFNDDTGKDDGTVFPLTVQTTNLDFGTHKKKIFDAVTVIGDIATNSSSPLNISFSDDDYATFSTPRSILMSSQANRLTRWGASRRRSWKITHSTGSPLRLEAMEFEYRLGNP